MADEPVHISDWLSRVTIPDMYPRWEDPFQPGPGISPSGTPTASLSPPTLSVYDTLISQLTSPGSRPIVYERLTTFAFTATTTPTAITNARLNVDEIIIDVPSSALNSVFVSFGSQVSTATGLEVRPGIPLVLTPVNTREMWELQRVIEYIAALMALDRGLDPLPPYRAPRVVFDPSQYFIVATASTSIQIGLFYIPEQQ